MVHKLQYSNQSVNQIVLIGRKANGMKRAQCDNFNVLYKKRRDARCATVSDDTAVIQLTIKFSTIPVTVLETKPHEMEGENAENIEVIIQLYTNSYYTYTL